MSKNEESTIQTNTNATQTELHANKKKSLVPRWELEQLGQYMKEKIQTLESDCLTLSSASTKSQMLMPSMSQVLGNITCPK
jgi:hypothetical protein